jgi:hypothetical protein
MPIVTSSSGASLRTMAGARCQKCSTKSKKSLLLGNPAHEMRTASSTPPQRSWCSTSTFSKRFGLDSPFGLMQRT